MDITPTTKTHGASLIITIIVSIIILVITALLAIIYTTQFDSKTHFVFPNINNTDALSTTETKLANQGKLQQFNSYSDLTEYIEQQRNNSYTDFGGGIRNFTAVDMIMEESAMPLTAIESFDDSLEGGGDYSDTNIQVEGVDEADIIKTDGSYIYTVSENTVYIIDAQPAEDTNIVSKIELKNNPTSIYINDNSLIIFGADYSLFNTKRIANILPRSQYTFVLIYDISDKSNPKEIQKLDFEGLYTNSRMIGDYLYFITSYWPNIYTDLPIPRLLNDGVLVCNSDIPDGLSCPYVNYFDIPYPSQQMTTVSAINVTNADEEITRNIYILERSQNIYVSENALYLTTVKYLNEFQLSTEVLREIVESNLSDKLKKKIIKIELADSDILSDAEKIQKINSILQAHILALSVKDQESVQKDAKNLLKKKYEELKDELQKTIINKITLAGSNMTAAGTGEVSGTVLNQFSMDENNEFFRIATTNNQRWIPWLDEQQKSSNNLYILDKNLNLTGSITNIAPDEKIFSVRFMQNRAYMVTFEQIDPLFVIDVKDPYNPSILGKLKIPGFSNYLHPYDQNTIIGVGQSTVIDEFDRVRTEGVKLSLFDVSNVSNPQEIDNYIVNERSSTLVQNDHKAFLFSKNKNLIVLPINTWDKDPFNGVMVFNVTKNGFTRRGIIEHDNSSNYNRYSSQIKRSLYIGDALYTLSNSELKVNNLDTLDNISSIKLNNKKQKGYPEPIPLIDFGDEFDIDQPEIMIKETIE